MGFMLLFLLPLVLMPLFWFLLDVISNALTDVFKSIFRGFIQ